MNPDLARQQEAFKKTLLQQPVIQKRPATEHQQAAPVFTRTASSSSVESLSEEFRLGDGPHHINSYVHAIINFLKQLRGEVSYDDIRRHLNIDIDSNPELIAKIVLNERINVRARMLSYKHLYNISSGEDLMELLRNQAGISGVLIQDLRDSCAEIDALVQQRVKTGDILAIRAKDDSVRVLFYNQLRLEKPLDARFKVLWGEQRVPAGHDLEQSLERAGLKSLSVSLHNSKPTQQAPKKASLRKNTRRIKITNTHIEGLDFSQGPAYKTG